MPVNGAASPEPSQWPQHVGILAMDIYFPHQFVDQVSAVGQLDFMVQ